MKIAYALQKIFHQFFDFGLSEFGDEEEIFELVFEVLHDDVDFGFAGAHCHPVYLHDVGVTQCPHNRYLPQGGDGECNVVLHLQFLDGHYSVGWDFKRSIHDSIGALVDFIELLVVLYKLASLLKTARFELSRVLGLLYRVLFLHLDRRLASDRFLLLHLYMTVYSRSVWFNSNHLRVDERITNSFIFAMAKRYSQGSWADTLRNNIKSLQHLHTHNPNYISKPPLELYQTNSKPHYLPKQSIDRDLVWKSSSHRVLLNRSKDYVFRSVTKRVDDYHKRNDCGNIIAHHFIRNPSEEKAAGIHPAVQKRKQIRASTCTKDDALSRSTTTVSIPSASKPNYYMDSKLMKQSLQYDPAPKSTRRSYMPKALRGK